MSVIKMDYGPSLNLACLATDPDDDRKQFATMPVERLVRLAESFLSQGKSQVPVQALLELAKEQIENAFPGVMRSPSAGASRK